MLGESHVKCTSVGIFGHPLKEFHKFKEVAIVKVEVTTFNKVGVLLSKTILFSNPLSTLFSILTLMLSKIVGFFCPKVEASTFPLEDTLLGLAV